MKEIIFKELRLTDWRAQNRTVRFNEGCTRILGRNASGKSTTWDAILWLLTGYDSLDRNNYQLFDTRVEPTMENSRPAIVELDFSVDSVDYSLKKVAKMGWVRKRGTDSWTKKPSDDYSFYLDGVEVPAATYRSFIEGQFCSMDKLKFILNIDYFLMLDWRDLRKHFADIIGEVKDSDYEGDYSAIIELVKRYGTLDAVKEYLNTQRKPLREAIGDFSAKGSKVIELETLESTLPDISDVETAKTRIEELQKELEALDEAKRGKEDAIKPYVEKRNAQKTEIDSLQTALSKERLKFGDEKSKARAALYAEKYDIQAENELIERENRKGEELLEAKRGALDGKRRLLANAERELDILRENLQKNKELEFTGAVCSFCGQILPEKKLEEERAEFNRRKEEKHRYIMTEGRIVARNVEDLRAGVMELEKIIEDGFTPKPLKSMDEINERIEAFEGDYPKFEDTPVFAITSEKIRNIEANMVSVPVLDLEGYTEKRNAILESIKAESEKVGIMPIYESHMKRIDSLRNDVKAMTAELVRLEGMLFSVDAMEREKADIVRRRVNSLFDICDVQMEERKKDGGMAPACNILVRGVKAQVTNTASKILAGIDIANAFSRFYGLKMPLIVDNRERVDGDICLGKGQQLIELERYDTDFKIV